MNWVDLAVLAVIVLSGVLAMMRGLVREVLGVGAWIIAALVASSYGLFPYVQPWMRQQFSDPTTADIVAFGSVFVIALITLWMIAGALSNAVRGSALGGLDRTLGFVFGLARGAVLVAAAYVIAGMAIPVARWPVAVTQARLLPTVHDGAVWVASQVPLRFRPAVTPLPPGRSINAASLLQSSPKGRAYGSQAAQR